MRVTCHARPERTSLSRYIERVKQEGNHHSASFTKSEPMAVTFNPAGLRNRQSIMPNECTL